MMYSLHSLHYAGIPVTKTVRLSLGQVMIWYTETLDGRYLELAELYMQAYVNLGYVLDDGQPEISKLLGLLGKTKKDFYPDAFALVRRVRLTRPQVRSMIGKWKPSKENPMTISQVVDDIIAKAAGHQEGRYVYVYNRKYAGADAEPELYELVIGKDTCYFYDVNNLRFYMLEK